MDQACYSSRVGGLSGWRLPSLAELGYLYQNREKSEDSAPAHIGLQKYPLVTNGPGQWGHPTLTIQQHITIVFTLAVVGQ